MFGLFVTTYTAYLDWTTACISLQATPDLVYSFSSKILITLLGDENFKSHTYRNSVGSSYSHDVTYTQNAERCTKEDYDRVLLRDAFARASRLFASFPDDPRRMEKG